MAKLNQAMTDLLRYNAAMLPQVRSRFDKSHSHTTTFDSGYLIPLMWDRVLPGDEKEIRISSLVRMTTPIHPVMDSAYFYTWCVYVPDRLWWNHAKEFYGENKDASFNPDGEYVMPYLKPSQYVCCSGNGSFPPEQQVGSLNDYLGMPFFDNRSDLLPNSGWDNDMSRFISAGLHRCYQLTWNELFRNSSIQPALQLNDGDTVTDEEWQVINKLRKVNKHPDRFTTLLLEPQAGEDVLLPMDEYLPVVSRNAFIPDSEYTNNSFVQAKKEDVIPGQDLAQVYFGHFNGVDVNSRNGYLLIDQNATADMATTDVNKFNFANIWARTNGYIGSINDLRSAITIQQLLEKDNEAGKRYQNILYRHFSVFTPDATVQRPELLGASVSMLGMRQVLQSSESTDTSPQGNPAAVSVTNVNNEWLCNKAFTEPGILMVLGAIRVTNSFSQGVDPLLRKLNRFDHYWPVFDNLGNQPVYQSEIFADFAWGDGVANADAFNKVLGYKEAWQEYKIKDNRVSGLMRPNVEANLATWNYSSYFDSPVILNSEFIEENPNLVDRTIAVPSEPQFLCDCYFEYFDTKSMSTHSVPGLTRL